MRSLELHELHRQSGATFVEVQGCSMVAHYGDPKAEYEFLQNTCGVLDLSARSRLVLLGADRHRMLNGQVTNNVKDLQPGQGCYAALVTAKAKMISDLTIYALAQEILLDFEPGLTSVVSERLDKFVLGDDVQIVDVAPHYGLVSAQGPKAAEVVQSLELFPALPETELSHVVSHDLSQGESYLMRHSRVGVPGFDLHVPVDAMSFVFEALVAAAKAFQGGACGWEALEVARVEAGIPRFKADMTEATLPPEAGITERAISYTKGCYSGQEVIARIRTYGQVARALRRLLLTGGPETLVPPGTKLFREGKEVGWLTSVAWSPRNQRPIGLGYVRRECNAPGTELVVGDPEQGTTAIVANLQENSN